MPSEIRAYLEQKAALPEKEWLRREPRETHSAILAAVCAFRDAGGFYDDDAERYVEGVAGDLPEHRHHGHDDRHRLTYQLGHEVYIAKGIIGDEERTCEIGRLRTEGFERVADAEIVDGGRYLVRFPTTYVGHEVPTYGDARPMRAVRSGGRWALKPKGARRLASYASPDTLVRVGWPPKAVSDS